jgi:hypothetical protein
MAVKNKWSRAWTQAWFYCKVPLLLSPSPKRGKGLYALHSYMMGLDFAMEPSFECLADNAGDMAFIKAMRTIDSRNTMKEYMACGLFHLSVSFGLGEIVDGEMLVLKLAAPMPEFPIVRLL